MYIAWSQKHIEQGTWKKPMTLLVNAMLVLFIALVSFVISSANSDSVYDRLGEVDERLGGIEDRLGELGIQQNVILARILPDAEERQRLIDEERRRRIMEEQV